MSSSSSQENDSSERKEDKVNDPSVYDFSQHARCSERVRIAYQSNPYVKYMLAAMKMLGCHVDHKRDVSCFSLKDSEVRRSAGFDPLSQKISVAEENCKSHRIAFRLLTHELIHAYDQCRAKVDWMDLRHVACTEIRASNLSGECSFMAENLYAFRFGYKNHHQACVRRYAQQSMMSRGISGEDAQSAIDAVWDSCIRDYAPFKRIPRDRSDLNLEVNSAVDSNS